jgi:O-antigen ligase
MPVVAVALVLVLLTGSRGGFVAIAIALAAFVLLEVRSPQRLLPALAVAAAVLALTLGYTRVGRAARASYDERVRAMLLHERYTAGRSDLYRSGWQLAWTAPVVGGGLAAFPARGLGVYPHNLFLEAFCETGLVGVWLLALCLGSGVLSLVRREHPPDGATAAAFVLILVASQFSGDLYDSRALFALLVAAGAAPDVEAPAHRPLRILALRAPLP